MAHKAKHVQYMYIPEKWRLCRRVSLHSGK